MRKIICFIILLFSITCLSYSIETSFGKFKYYPKNINWKKTSTENFNIYYSGTEKSMIPVLAQFAEDAYNFNAEIFNDTLKNKLNIVLYSSPLYFSQNQIYPYFLPPNVAGFATFKRDRIVIPFNGDLKRFQELIYHETSHIFQYHKFLKNPLTGILAEEIQLSTWIFEGLSERAVSEFSSDGYMILKDAVLNGYLHSAEYMKNNQNYDYLAYQQSHSMINYLNEYYSVKKFDDFLNSVNYTLNIDRSLQKVYDFTFDEFYIKWKNYIANKIYKNQQGKKSIINNKNSKLIKKNNIILFDNENFYIEYSENKLSRKSFENDNYNELLFKSTPFKHLIYSKNMIDISQNELFLVFSYYNNNNYYAGIYNFATKSLKTIKLPSITNIDKIKFFDQNIYILGSKGLSSIIYKVNQNYRISTYFESKNNIKAFLIINDNLIYFSSYGSKTYIHFNNKIKQINGEIKKAEKYSSNSVIMLITRNTENFLSHLNLNNFEIYKFMDYKEPITDFNFSKNNLILNILNNKTNITLITSFPEYHNKISTRDIYRVPKIEDDITYKAENIQSSKPNLIPRFENLFSGLSIEENKYLRLSIGSSFNNILNESILNWQIGTFLKKDTKIDFSIDYLKTGNRPNFNINLSKRTKFRNDKEFYKNQLQTRIIYPLSISSSINLTGGYYLYGFDDNNLNDNLFLGGYYSFDDTYGRVFPFYGKRFFIYLGYLSNSSLNYEFKLDSRYYYLPFMFRFFYQTSDLLYFDDTYIRGYRDKYFASKNKIVFNSEIRIPLVANIPTLKKNNTLPLMTVYSFFDIGLFADNLNSTKLYEEKKLIDPVSSIGYGFSVHFSRMLSLDFSFSHKTDLKNINENPVFEFSINKELY
ncbi:MAG: hypothetical protein FXF47_01275 [Candidatus Mcinerneyibacterium aminivorans]|uniref:Peptidase MA-like domain-containing protein n=1 Tax=Candidatus Mcinerneyibacterium aminivorans TaxID=2703815 RepID=A0A5D0MN33_9BACT|nr:MAG: hypothetical protein FXF47_01275 [Candidatus Mcinerneyibacterium aminivorans]